MIIDLLCREMTYFASGIMKIKDNSSLFGYEPDIRDERFYNMTSKGI